MKKFVVFLILISGNLALGFNFTSKSCSYPQSQDFYRLLKEKFKYVFADKTFNPGNNPTSCLSYVDNTIFGGDDPATGSPVYAEPSPALVRFFSSCVYPLVRADLFSAVLAGQEISRYFSKETWSALVETEKKISHGVFILPDAQSAITYKPVSENTQVMGQRYTDLSPELKQAVLHDLLIRFIGPGILRPAKEKLYLAKIEKGTDGSSTSTVLGDEIVEAVFLMSMTPEFLTSCSAQ